MPRSSSPKAGVVVGIDVGGPSKGFHAVALQDGRYRAQLATSDIDTLVQWCVSEMDAAVIAIDAPCGWSVDGRGRPAERELMKQRIWCFSTPTRATAMSHPRQYYSWMLRGMALYDALSPTHPVRDPRASGGERYCFETFPHAITWHSRGGDANARRKREQRRALLDQVGIDRQALTNIDTVDAALCAYVAHLAVMGAGLLTFGELGSGLIVVPPLVRPC
jgi:predicted nuclease with RNAse H fold